MAKFLRSASVDYFFQSAEAPAAYSAHETGVIDHTTLSCECDMSGMSPPAPGVMHVTSWRSIDDFPR